MPIRPIFILFGPAHLMVLGLALLIPVALALIVRRSPHLDRPVRFALAAILGGGWLCWYALFAMRGWLNYGNALPLNLCDWAAVALIAALLTRHRFAYVLGYFWGLGGTLQGLITPDIAYGFPDPQFIFFSINHAGIMVALLYLTFTGLRPVAADLPRMIAATLGYALVVGIADFALRTDYGFMAGKPHNPSLLDFLSSWPWYIPELVLIGVLSLLVYYAPFWFIDSSRRKTYAAQSIRTPGIGA